MGKGWGVEEKVKVVVALVVMMVVVCVTGFIKERGAQSKAHKSIL